MILVTCTCQNISLKINKIKMKVKYNLNINAQQLLLHRVTIKEIITFNVVLKRNY
jgi:hypothetical protein